MLHFFCPGCWSDFTEDHPQCPKCGLRIHDLMRSTDFVGKLILALHHPEQGTAIRAAWILGKLRTPRAVEPLRELLATTRDVYIATAAASALGRIGTPEARQVLHACANYPALMVREEVQRGLAHAALEEQGQ
ncbi:MAG TPA: HEAT repeat domain-containing protein [Planctomycetota bacterium]|nr:HEAT repeat domain-containing protein [Planctomycetota bacterium]HRR81448.1 HEAT repeat domain-containing protein [Planctomycetota bacterium]HRT94962.1 HEAT repeat domain-containing protein [Planctomycetota bacterium]